MHKDNKLSIEEMNLLIHIIRCSHNSVLANAEILELLKKKEFNRYDKTIELIDMVLGSCLKYAVGRDKLSNQLKTERLVFKPINRKTINSIMMSYFNNDYSRDLWTNMMIKNLLCIDNEDSGYYIFKDDRKITLAQFRHIIKNDLFGKFKRFHALNGALSIKELLGLMASNADHSFLMNTISDDYSKLMEIKTSISTRHVNQTLKLGAKQTRPSTKLPTPPPIQPVVASNLPTVIHEEIKSEPEEVKVEMNFTDDKFMLCGVQLPYSVELLDAMPCSMKRTICNFKGFTSYRGEEEAFAKFPDRRVIEYKRVYGLLVRARFLDACMAKIYIYSPLLAISMRLWETKEGHVKFNGKEYCVADETNPLIEKDDISLAINYGFFTSVPNSTDQKESVKEEIKSEKPTELSSTSDIGVLKENMPTKIFGSTKIDPMKSNQSFKMKILKQLSEINRLFDKVELLQAANLFVINMPDGGYKNNLHNISAINQITFNQTTSIIATLKTNGFIKIINNKIILNTNYFSDLTFEFEEEFCDGEERYAGHSVEDYTG